MKPLLKICGLTREDDVALCCRLGVDICGFVTDYPISVPWNLSMKQCAKLIRKVRRPSRSCIVTGGDTEQICRLVQELRPDFVQLHYNESLENTAKMIRILQPLGIGVIKTLPAAEAERLEQFGERTVEQCVQALYRAGAAAILVDSRTPSNAGSSGTMVDLLFYQQVRRISQLPVILAGGITPENYAEILRAAAPEAIDIMTGVESAPGVKSKVKLLHLMKSLRGNG